MNIKQFIRYNCSKFVTYYNSNKHFKKIQFILFVLIFCRNENSRNLSGLDLDKLKTYNFVFVTSATDHVFARVPASDGSFKAPKRMLSIYFETPCKHHMGLFTTTPLFTHKKGKVWLVQWVIFNYTIFERWREMYFRSQAPICVI